MGIYGDFKPGVWNETINVSDFVYRNITPYTGDASFLKGASKRTRTLWDECLKAIEEERQNGGVR